MDMKQFDNEELDRTIHDDLEKIFQIAVDVEFESSLKDYDGLESFSTKIKKYVEPKLKIQHAEHRNDKRSLF